MRPRGDGPSARGLPFYESNQIQSHVPLYNRSTFIPSFFSSQASGIGAWVRPLLLGTLVLSVLGCSSTHEVTRDTKGYGRVTAAATGEPARVHLHDGRTLKLERLYVGNDSTSGVTPSGTERAFSTSAVQEIQILDRSSTTGTLMGAGIGGALPFTIGFIRARSSDGLLEGISSLMVGAVLIWPGALLGGLVGRSTGQRETYRFSPASPEADSAQAALRSRLPATRRQAAEHP